MKRALVVILTISLLTISVSMASVLCVLPAVAQQLTNSRNPDSESGKNKDASGATEIELDKADEKGKISYNDGDRTDWYMVYVGQDGKLVFTLRNRIAGDLTLEAYGPDMTKTLTESVTPETGNEEVSFLVEADNWYYAKVYAKQPGDEGDYTISNTFHDDITPPEIILPQSEWTTTEDSLTIMGTVKDNKKVTAIRVNGTDILSLPSTTQISGPSGEIWTFTYHVEKLKVGENPVTIEAEDGSENLASLDTLSITRQNPPPTITLTAPEDGIRFTDDQIVIRGTITDDRRVSQIHINEENITDAVDVIGENEVNFSYLIKNIAYGELKIIVIAEDNRGQKTQETLTIYRDAPPEIIITSHSDGDHVESATIEVQGSVKDDFKISQISISINNNEINISKQCLSPAEKKHCEFIGKITDLQYGPNEITVEAKDDREHVSVQPITIHLEEIPPKITIYKPQNNAPVVQEPVLVEGIALDTDGIEVVTVNEVPVQVDTSGAFHWQILDLSPGPHDITVKADDIRGNRASASIHITKIDKTPPEIVILQPEDGAKIIGNVVVVNVSVRDSDRIEQITIHGQEQEGTREPGQKRLLTHLIENLQDGENRIEVTAIDVNENEGKRAITIQSLDPDYNSEENKDPAGAVQILLNGGTEENVKISYNEGNRTDWYKIDISEDGELDLILANAIDGNLNLEVYQADQTTQLGEAATPETGNEYLSLSVPGGGWYYVRVYANQPGDAGDYSLQTIFREKDLTPPEVILKQTALRTEDSSITIEGVVKDNKQTAVIRVNGSNIFSFSEVISKPEEAKETRKFSYTFENLEVGNNIVAIQAEDASGNVALPVQLKIFRYDNPPVITVTNPEDGDRFREPQIIIRGTVRDNEHVKRLFINEREITISGISSEVRIIENNHVIFTYPLTDIAYGKHEITVVAEDDLGQTDRETLNVYRDAPPSIIITSPREDESTKDDAMKVHGVITDDRKISQITVNGVEVSDASIVPPLGGGEERDFTYTVADLQYGQNDIIVEVKDDIGNITTRRLYIYREEIPPTIFVRTPNNGDEIFQGGIEVKGMASDADGIAIVTVHNEPVEVDESGEFIHQIPNLPYGSVSIVVEATDSRKNKNRVSVQITRVDQVSPVIEIISPEEDEAKTTKEEISVKVKVTDNDRIAQIEINEQEIRVGTEPPESEKSFTTTIKDLQDGENIIQVTAQDASGNSVSKSIQVHKIPPPTIVISQPESGVQTVADTILIEGHIQTEDEITSLFIAGDEVPVDQKNNNSFSYQVQQLHFEGNMVNMTATDSLGGKAQKTLTITRKDPNYRSGDDRVAEGAVSLVVNNVINDVKIDYDGDRTDWFKIFLDTTGELTVKVRNTLSGDLDLELYRPDKVTSVRESKTPDSGNETVTVKTTQKEVYYYAKVTAAGVGDRGKYTISNRFAEVDTASPVLTITEPATEESRIAQKEITIAGTAKDNSDIKEIRIVGDGILPLGGASIKGNTAHFTYTVKRLRQGDNILKVIAVDKAGNTSEKEIYVVVASEERQSQPIVGEKEQSLSIRVISVGEAKSVKKDSTGNITWVETENETLNVEGIVSGPEEVKDVKIKVSISGTKGVVPIEKTQGHFQFNAGPLLIIEDNAVTIEAIDTTEQSVQHVLVVVRKPPGILTPTSTTSRTEIEQLLRRLRPGEVYAVVIGIGDYQDDRLDLRFAENDAQRFYDVLIDPDHGRVPIENVKLLLNQEATYQNIKGAIGKWLRTQAKEEDTVLIYYSGHGAFEGDETYWVTHQADIDNLFATALNNNENANMLDRVGSKRVVIFLDSCYSAATVQREDRTKSFVGEFPLDKFSGEGRVTISASDGKQKSVELEEYGHGVFTYYLLEGLQGEADTDLDGVIVVDEIWDYVKYQVTETARKAGLSQTPKNQGEHTAGIPLTFNVPFLQGKLSSQELQDKKNRLLELFHKGEISNDQFAKALGMVKTGQESQVLEDFWAGEISLDVFKEQF